MPILFWWDNLDKKMSIKNRRGINSYKPRACFSGECYRCSAYQGRNITTKITSIQIGKNINVSPAVKVYHLIWNHQEKWKNVIIHLGDFHDFLVISEIIGKYIKCSGFEDIVYLAKPL